MVAVMTFVMVMSFMASQESIPKIEMVEIPGLNIKMLKTEVTQELYESVMGVNPSRNKGDDLPVESVSWYDAIYFCNMLSLLKNLEPVYSVNGETDVRKWAYMPHEGNLIRGEITQNTSASGFRLPTLAEWEYAARGGENYRYAGSDDLDEVGWYDENSDYKTHPVAQKKPNGYGLYDMSGNVWEWVWDSFNGGNRRYNCGGSCNYYAIFCGVASRGGNSANNRNNGIGFRVVCPSK